MRRLLRRGWIDGSIDPEAFAIDPGIGKKKAQWYRDHRAELQFYASPFTESDWVGDVWWGW